LSSSPSTHSFTKSVSISTPFSVFSTTLTRFEPAGVAVMVPSSHVFAFLVVFLV